MAVSWPTGTTRLPNGLPSMRIVEHRAVPPAAAEIVDPQHHLRALADNGEARGIHDGELAVALAALARDQHLQRRLAASSLRAARHALRRR